MLCILLLTIQTCLAINQVSVSCVDTDFRLDKITRELRLTGTLRYETSLPSLRSGKRSFKFCTLYFLQKPDLLQATFADLWVVKRTTLIASNSFFTVATTVLDPVYMEWGTPV